jgi:sterol O-acyltransferase
VATFGTFALLYSITETFILPHSAAQQNFLIALLDLALPFMVAYLLLFFIIFGAPMQSALR